MIIEGASLPAPPIYSHPSLLTLYQGVSGRWVISHKHITSHTGRSLLPLPACSIEGNKGKDNKKSKGQEKGRAERIRISAN
jgi:hypothetical protein